MRKEPAKQPGAHKPAVNVTLEALNEAKFKVAFPFNNAIIDALRTVPSASFDRNNRYWTATWSVYDAIRAKLRSIQSVSVHVQDIPQSVVNSFKTAAVAQHSAVAKVEDLASRIDRTLLDTAFPFQRRGIEFGVQHNGRVLLADEMGLGKSIQALGIARYFGSEWPLLIVCPSSVKGAWRKQFQRFLPCVDNIHMIEKGSDPIPNDRSTSLVVIMSYDILVNKRKDVSDYDFRVIIFDESHMLKEPKAQRTKAATEISKKALRVILLSGTPALNRPIELFSQIRLINPRLFTSYDQFGIRYCDGRKGFRGYWDFKGASNMEELQQILTSQILIRRLKKDVLDDLPDKRREVVELQGDLLEKHMAQLKKAHEEFSKTVAKYRDGRKTHESLVQFYTQTSEVKAKPVGKYIIENYFHAEVEQRKVLIFAHHHVVLDVIGSMLTKNHTKYIRIDGSTSSRDREAFCDQFQNDPTVLAAVLSITAAGVGITLTAASIVIFAELHWNPQLMKQAEDRAHRVGQKDSVEVKIIIARKTADDFIWRIINKKLEVLNAADLADNDFKEADSIVELFSSTPSITQYFKSLENSQTEEPPAKVPRL
ncbi:Helicase conserved C-terminal domain containing protein [Aphelenchoides avenae]|nr:Helicase conserved C-terminal domain containing protein [Aphelenchus avenae]